MFIAYTKYIPESEDIMLGELKADCFIRVYLIAMNVQLEYFEYRYKKILYRYHDINIYRYYRYIVAALLLYHCN